MVDIIQFAAFILKGENLSAFTQGGFGDVHLTLSLIFWINVSLVTRVVNSN